MKFCAQSRLLCLLNLPLVFAIPAFSADAPPSAAPKGTASGEVGRELQALERRTADPAAPASPEAVKKAEAAIQKAADPAASAPAKPVAPAAATAPARRIEKVTVKDAHNVLGQSHTPILAEMNGLQGTEQSLATAATRAEGWQNRLREGNGYWLCKVTAALDGAHLTFTVTPARVGRTRYFDYQEPPAGGAEARLRAANKPPFSQKYYSIQQIDDKLAEYLPPGSAYHYNGLRHALLELTGTPDLRLDTDLLVRNDPADGYNYIDMDFHVREKFPLHFAAEFNDTGTRSTGDFRLNLSLQHANLFKRNHVLTLSAPLSIPDIDKLRSISGGYSIPYSSGNGGGVSAFAGYSKLKVDEIDGTELGLEGEGTFFGLRGFYRLVNNPFDQLNLSLGGTYRRSEDAFVLGNEPSDSPTIEVLPLSIGLVYSANNLDRLNGRNLATALSVYNPWDTDEAAVENQRANADTGYFVQKLQLARIQELKGVPGLDQTESYLFARVDSQYSPNVLIPSEELVAGGGGTVRGYYERDVTGDSGIIASLEWRTGIANGFIDDPTPGADTPKEDPSTLDNWQGVLFLDGAWLTREVVTADPSGAGTRTRDEERTMLSVGLGLRCSVSEHFQVRVDYGFPLQDSDSPNWDRVKDEGRVHFSAQAQF